jgi:hypothetical protein
MAYSSGFVLPSGGIDNGWALGLSWARVQGLQWGGDIAFTYGPWGFLSLVVPLSPFLAWSFLASSLLLLGLVASTTFRIVTPEGRWWGLLAAFFVSSVATYGGYANTALIAVALLAIAWVLDRRSGPWWLFANGLIAGFSLLIKFNIGVTAVAIALLMGLARPRIGANLVIAGGSIAIGLGAGWVLAGESLIQLPYFLSQSADLALGYRTGLGSSSADLPNQRFVFSALAAVVVAGTLYLAFRLSDGLSRSARGVLLAIVAITGVSLYFASSVRFDSGHVPIFLVFIVCLSFPLSMAIHVTSRRVGLTASATLLVVSVVSFAVLLGPSGTTKNFNPVQSVRDLADSIHVAVSAPAREEQLALARASILADYPVPAWELDLHNPFTGVLPAPSESVMQGLGVSTLHAEPWAVGLAWASGNEWKPVPVFQTFQAYSIGLDEVNAREIASTEGANAVLRQVVALDGKNPSWESPLYQRELMCRFTQTASDEYWQALVRANTRCNQPRTIEQVRAVAGEVIPVPTIDGSLITMDVHRASSFGGGIFAESTIACGDVKYRVAQGLNTVALVVRADAVPWSAQFLPATCETVSFPTEVDITFAAVPVTEPTN